MRLILASASPSRLRLLRAAGIDPEVVVSAVDEDQMLEQMPDASPQEVAVVLAQAKARDVAVRHPGWLVLGRIRCWTWTVAVWESRSPRRSPLRAGGSCVAGRRS